MSQLSVKVNLFRFIMQAVSQKKQRAALLRFKRKSANISSLAQTAEWPSCAEAKTHRSHYSLLCAKAD